MRIGIRLAAAAALLAVAAVRPSAQATPPAGQGAAAQAAGDQKQATFRSRIDTIMVDVQVTDKQGRPVLDLTPQDFEIRENNKIQTIDTFRLIKLDETPVDPATLPSISSLDDQQREVAKEDSRLIVIFMDDYHVMQVNGLRIRDQLATFVKGLAARDLVAIMTPLMPVSSLTFTRDHASIAAEIRRFNGRKREYHVVNPFDQMIASLTDDEKDLQRTMVSISALQSVCAYLGSLREGRKTLLYVSEGFKAVTQGFGLSNRGTSPPPSEGSAMMTQMQNIFADATRSNTSIYTMDARGLAVNEYGVSSNKTPEQDRADLYASMDSLRVLAENTGGRAIMNSNDPMPMLRQMTRDSSVYYLLSYTSTERYRDGRFHPIKVNVLRRKDVEIQARKGYYAYSEDDVARIIAPPKPGLPKEVKAALENLDDTKRGRAVQVWLGATRGADGKALVTLLWEALPVAPGELLGAVDHVRVTATSLFGDPLFSGAVPRDPSGPGTIGRVTFAAPPGTVAVRVVAESEKGLRLDSDDTDFAVPDFTAVAVTITRPVVFRARSAVDVRQIRAAAAPMPSVGRSFQRLERLLIRFQALGPGGAAPKVAARLLNALGEPMAEMPEPAPIGDGTYEIDLSLSALPAGEFLIEITADAAGTQAKTLFAFRIAG